MLRSAQSGCPFEGAVVRVCSLLWHRKVIVCVDWKCSGPNNRFFSMPFNIDLHFLPTSAWHFGHGPGRRRRRRGTSSGAKLTQCHRYTISNPAPDDHVYFMSCAMEARAHLALCCRHFNLIVANCQNPSLQLQGCLLILLIKLWLWIDILNCCSVKNEKNERKT